MKDRDRLSADLYSLYKFEDEEGPKYFCSIIGGTDKRSIWGFDHRISSRLGSCLFFSPIKDIIRAVSALLKEQAQELGLGHVTLRDTSGKNDFC